MLGKGIFLSFSLIIFAVFILTNYSLWAGVLLLYWFFRLLLTKSKHILICSILLILLFLVRYHAFTERHSILTEEEAPFLIQVKKTSVKTDGNSLSFQGEINEAGQTEEVMVFYRFETEEEKRSLLIESPDTFLVEGEIGEPNEATNFYQFDYKDFLNKKQIYKVIDAEKLTLITHPKIKRSLTYRIDSIRQTVLSFIDRMMSKQSALYTKALLFSDKRDLPEPVSHSFRELGIVHLLSISGLHIHFFISSVKKVLMKLSVTKETSRWVFLLTLPFYGLMTGFGVSVFRAIGQSWIKLFAETKGIKITTLDSWSIVFCLAILMDPNVIFNVGFQLSYFISLLIILLVNQPFYKEYKAFKAYCILSLLIFIGSIPILSYHFFEFSWGVVLLNSMYIPFMSFIFLPMLAVLFVLSPILGQTSLFTFILHLSDGVIYFLEETTLFISQLTSFSFVTGRLSGLAMALLAFSFIGMVLLLESRKQKWLQILPVLGMFISIVSVSYSPFGQVMMIDVGQGESILIKEPFGQGNYLIDTGGLISWRTEEEWMIKESLFSVGKDVVVPVLKAHGVSKLDTVILTHPDWDHFGALEDIYQSIPIRTLLATEKAYQEEVMKDVLTKLYQAGTDIKTIEEYPELYLPSKFKALYPLTKHQTNINNHSLVLVGLVGEYSWLFTGDLEEEGEQDLLKLYPNLSVDVLKVGHHGSNTSTHEALLNHLTPTYAWLSAGRNNIYGHPHPLVMERLEDRDIEVFQTNTHGALKYTYTNHKWLSKMINKNAPFEMKMSE